ncbi:hypothetical protein P618_200907 [Holospora obtusa F1]|uniref:Uncharacterized protein n=1 Tax=Holospora obtusa F1 TaxID=1399147 RepID=W6TE71_HOLOB|nr:IS1 transposase [Holospora obtusa]ETZ06934.1 hypothetical protein P618_200907 [Holospora obtusa F1]
MTGMLSLKSLPKNRHSIGKSGTVCIEQDNGNTKHHLGRMTRSTKVVSKKEIYGIRINQALVCAYDTRNL